MRVVLALMLSLLVFLPYAGCGGGRPDPRDREDFVDTADPSKVMVPAAEPGKTPAQPPGGGAAKQ
jgi:hypothetical protein